jgi:hypothetical protein
MNMKLSIAAAVAATALLSSMASASLIVSFEQTNLPANEVTFSPVVPATPNALQSAAGFGAAIGVRVTDFAGNIYNNVEVVLTGHAAAGVAGSLFGNVGQQLGQGTFQLIDSGRNVLLSGTVADSTLFGSASTGSVTSTTVTYTGGSIFTAFQGIGGVATGGELSFTLLNITPALSVSSGNVNSFSASVNGQFSGIIPEPTALGLLAPAGLLLARRRR